MKDDCLFCRIAMKTQPVQLLYEDARCVVFNDIQPKAPTHLLVVPKEHLPKLDEGTEDHRELIGHLLLVLAEMARQTGVAAPGYRVVINNGPAGGQTVGHLHLHLLGGRTMHWPPG